MDKDHVKSSESLKFTLYDKITSRIAKLNLIKTALFVNFVFPAMLLNSIGGIIMALHQQGVSLSQMGWIQSLKDGSVLIASLFLVSFIARYGYRLAIQIGALLQMFACIFMALFHQLWTVHLFFMMVGVAFAMLKISIYSTIISLTKKDYSHASFISLIEGGFVAAIFAGNALFALTIRYGQWYDTFFIFSLFALIAFILSYCGLREEKIQKKESLLSNYKKIFTLLEQPAMGLFLLLALIYPFIEQGLMDFLPAFQNRTLSVSPSNSLFLVVMLSIMIALGRLLSAYLMNYFSSQQTLFVSMILAIIVLALSLLFTAYAQNHPVFRLCALISLSMTGLFIGPIYPILNSSLMAHQSGSHQSIITVLIMMTSAIGASLGSVSTGYLFDALGGVQAFASYLIALFFMTLLLIPYFNLLRR